MDALRVLGYCADSTRTKHTWTRQAQSQQLTQFPAGLQLRCAGVLEACALSPRILEEATTGPSTEEQNPSLRQPLGFKLQGERLLPFACDGSISGERRVARAVNPGSIPNQKFTCRHGDNVSSSPSRTMITTLLLFQLGDSAPHMPRTPTRRWEAPVQRLNLFSNVQPKQYHLRCLL